MEEQDDCFEIYGEARCQMRWRIPRERFKDEETFFEHFDALKKEKGDFQASEFVQEFDSYVTDCEIELDTLDYDPPKRG